MRNVLHDRHYDIGKVREEERYLAQTRSQSKPSGITLPELCGVNKGINLHEKPEKQIIKPVTMMPEVKIPI